MSVCFGSDPVPFVDWDPEPAMRMYCGAKKRRHGQAQVPVEHASKRVKRALNALVWLPALDWTRDAAHLPGSDLDVIRCSESCL